MNLQTVLKNKSLVTLFTALLTLLHVLWDFSTGGVPTHHFLASEDMPGVSNWWGCLTIPLLTWTSLTLIQKRKSNTGEEHTASSSQSMVIRNRFLTALLFGIVISIFWELRLEALLQYLILLPLAVSLFFKVYLPEHLLGFVLGMTFTFGGVLPIVIGLLLTVLCYIIYRVIREGALLIISRAKNSRSKDGA